MGEMHTFSSHKRWSDAETAVLHALYSSAPWVDILAALPGRTRRIATCKANEIGLRREKPPKRTATEVRESKRQQMANRRAAAPDVIKAQQRAWVLANRDRLNATRRAWHETRFFYVRAKRLPPSITARDLARLWKRQRGLCALSGVRLDRSAELDHKMPRSRGGSDAIENLQWVTHAANFAKRDLTVQEFHALCLNCARWIGRRIAMVDQLGLKAAA